MKRFFCLVGALLLLAMSLAAFGCAEECDEKDATKCDDDNLMKCDGEEWVFYQDCKHAWNTCCLETTETPGLKLEAHCSSSDDYCK